MTLIRRSRRVRGGAFALALAALSGCAPAPPPKLAEVPPNRIYVANESSNTVTVIDGGTFNVVGTVDAKNYSTHDLSLTRDGRLLFATNLASGRVSVIDTIGLETVASIYTGGRCHVVTLTNDNRQAWVANIGEDNISIIDVANLRILGTIPTGKGPTGLTFSRDGAYAYVSNQGDRTVTVIDTSSHRTIKSIPVGPNPHFLVVGPEGRIWGSNTGADNVYVIDPGSQSIVGTLKVGPSPQQIAFGYKGLAGPNAYITVGGLNKVVVAGGEPGNMRILEEIPVGERPNGIWANPQGTRVFVVHEGSNDLYVIDTGTATVLAKVDVGRKPIRVVVSR
jgi:YVTN family beta-propeller protein